MKFTKILASALLASTVAGSAFAADLPSRKAPVVYAAPVPVFTWTGLYVGVNAGYGFSGSNTLSGYETNGAAFTGLAFSGAAPKPEGFVGGGQIGYNHQFGALVAGIETDLQGSTLKGHSTVGSNNIGYSAIVTERQKVEYYGTIRGRLGFTVLPTLLAYVTGGLAYGNVRSATAYWDTANFSSFGAWNDTRVGYTLGAGLEYAFAPNWSAKVEYGYVDLGTIPAQSAIQLNGAGAITTFATVQNSSKVAFHTVRAGLNYKFGWGAGPVVARY